MPSDSFASVNNAIIGSDNGLLPGQHQANFRTDAGILLIRKNFSEILINIYTFLVKKMHLNMCYLHHQ